MRLYIILIIAMLFHPVQLIAGEKKEIVITMRADLVTKYTLGYSPVEFIGLGREFDSINGRFEDGIVKWVLPGDKPVYIVSDAFKNRDNAWLAEPGDSIYINSNEGQKLSFVGQGAEKFQLQELMSYNKGRVAMPSNKSYNITRSLNDYQEWNRYLDKELEVILPLIDAFRYRISPYSYQYIRTTAIQKIEHKRYSKFAALRGISREFNAGSGITSNDLCSIFDTSFYKEPARWLRSQAFGGRGDVGFIAYEVFRKFDFDRSRFFDNEAMRSKQRLLYFEQINKTYKGLLRESAFVELLTYHVIKKEGFTDETEYLLKKYYEEGSYPAHKNYVRAYESRARVLKAGQPAPDFSLRDTANILFNKSRIKGKVTLIDFWFTGCQGCRQITPLLKNIKHAFKEDTNVLFLNVSVDKDSRKWIKSIQEQRYTAGEGIHLYTNGAGDQHEMIRGYNVNAFPALYLLGPSGDIMVNPVPDPRKDSGAGIISLIRNELALLEDGPYVFYEDERMKSYTVSGESVILKSVNYGDSTVLQIHTDEYNKKFNVTLKKKLENEPCEFNRPQRMFILSDIEGNFHPFRKLLQANGIIDEKYNWIFGDGHLVVNGDVFDRGQQVTECLWLIYSLEEKARSAGGYVHFILGNHEIMNLSGDKRYNHFKYRKNTGMIEDARCDLYGINSALGQWLRTKNIIEKIGDVIFVHAGFGKDISRLTLSTKDMNSLARNYYDRSEDAVCSLDKDLSVLFDPGSSPFWYRSYYLDQERKVKLGGNGRTDTLYKTPSMEVDSVLKRFNAAHIVTGHTIIGSGNRVTSHYGNKVINVDTHHASGKSEALMIQGNEFYRVNSKGEKWLLFTQEDRE